MQRQAAFEDAKKHLKGALHCHTTRSDGRGTPEQVIALHVSEGYDFMALTDHRYYNYDSFGVPGITMLGGMEMDRGLPGAGTHCHHIVCIGAAREQGNGFAQDDRFDSVVNDTPGDTQKLLDWAHERGNLTVYCHPEWSGTPAREFDMLRGNFAMEIWNSGCALENGLDANAAYWDELLASGQRIFGVATDDGHEMTQHCKGWVMVSSENEPSAILDALRRGAFYSSTGPVIHDFYVDNGVAHVACSPVREIVVRHLRVPYRIARPQPGSDTLECASFDVRQGGDANYIRAVVTDAQGRRAWTNPIFLD